MSKKILFILSMAISLYAPDVYSEYRVYQYYVKSKFKLPYDTEAYLVTSTLDPLSYIAYHGGQDSIKIDLLRTWMCKGDTSKKELCKPAADLKANK